MKAFGLRLSTGMTFALLLLLVWGSATAAAAGNNAAILVGGSTVPGSGSPGSTLSVVVRVQNTGASTWTAGSLHRLGASPSNQLGWGGFSCGGYMNNLTDGRVFLCHDVSPGGTHDFRFNITLPSSGTARLSVQMVQDGVEWFGQTHTWDITISGSGGNLPDVVVDSVRPEPVSPQVGQSVQFVSVVRNQGNASTPSGTVIGVGYFIDGNYVTYGFSSNALAPGASTTITTQGGTWTATSGSHNLTAFADDINRFAESNENNNTRTVGFAVGGGCPNSSLPTPTDRWKLEIFNNRSLSGSTVEQRYDPAGPTGFTFNWGAGGPSSCAGSDNFGVRFSRSFTASASGNYTFTTTADDGVRLWVDGQLLIDRWIDQAPTTYQATRYLSAGSHDIRMDYYENGGGAYAALDWQFSGGSCPNSSLPTPTDRWKLEIFNNRSLSGSTVEQRYEAAGPTGFTFNWGAGGPSSCAGSDNFGVRFSRSFTASASGNYIFTTTADDGVRLWVDGQLLIDRWIDQAPTTYQATRYLSAGSHNIRMDYYENSGGAYAALDWRLQSGGGSGDLYGMNIDPANAKGNPGPQELRDVRARWVRIEWKVDPGYAYYDTRIAEYRNAGLKVLLIIDYSSVPPKPASNASDAEWTAYLQRYNNSLRDFAAHYRDGVDAWQIWNEPDLMAPGSPYDPGVPARHFGVMLRDAVTTIRGYSSRPIVTGGLASGDANYLAQARNAAGGLTVDAVAVHPYGQRAPDNWPYPSWGFGNMSDLFNRYLAFGKPLWVTEIGINDPDTSLHAQYLENVYRLARDQYTNRVQRVFWFCWSDGMVPPWGLLDGDGNPKATYYRYQSIAPPW